MAITGFSTTKEILRFEGTDQRSYWKRFAMLLAFSVIISTMGLLRDSSAVVIAAMLIAPLMSPILGISAAMVFGHTKRVFLLLTVVMVAANASIIVSWMLVHIADVPRAVIIPDQVLARTDPGIEDLVIALVAGAAGAYVQIHKTEASLLPGAAIGVSLVPPLSATGVLLYFGEIENAYEASLLFATNLSAIVLSACVVYISAGALSSVFKDEQRRLHFSTGVAATIAILSLIGVQLGQATYTRYLQTGTETLLAERLEEWARPVSIEIMRLEVDISEKTVELWAIVDLQLDAQNKTGSRAELLPARLTETPIREVFESILEDGYHVTVKYQVRMMGEGIIETFVKTG